MLYPLAHRHRFTAVTTPRKNNVKFQALDLEKVQQRGTLLMDLVLIEAYVATLERIFLMSRLKTSVLPRIAFRRLNMVNEERHHRELEVRFLAYNISRLLARCVLTQTCRAAHRRTYRQ